jgi:hypothetical protein
MTPIEEHRGSLTCRGSDGRTYNVDIFFRIATKKSYGGKTKRDGAKILTCEAGELSYVAKGHYRTSTGIDLKADEPDAP